jgi:predicted nucleic acid-binding Zn ribbon protein
MAKKALPIDSLGSVLERSLKRLDLAGRLNDYGVWPIWNEVVGKVIARNAQPEKIRNGTLIVRVSSPVWMQQLQFMKDMIAAKLNHRLKEEIVKNIFFTVGRIESAEEMPAPPVVNESAPRPELNEELISAIADPELRAAFKQLWKSYSGRGRKT